MEASAPYLKGNDRDHLGHGDFIEWTKLPLRERQTQ
jgi:hypothetical protein